MKTQEDVHQEATTYRLSMEIPLLQEHLCLFIVYILLVAVGELRWKSQILEHEVGTRYGRSRIGGRNKLAEERTGLGTLYM